MNATRFLIVFLCTVTFFSGGCKFPEGKKSNQYSSVLTVPLNQTTLVKNGALFDRAQFDCDDKGFPSNSGIKYLAQSYWPELGDLTVEGVSAGASTSAIFSVANDERVVFFFKVSLVDDDFSVWHNLKAVQDNVVNKIKDSSDSCLPIVTSVEQFFTYTVEQENDSKNYIIEVIHAAQGISAANLAQDDEVFIEDLKQAAYMIGRSLGAFHKFFMKHAEKNCDAWRTVTHGDFHTGNVFVEGVAGKDCCNIYFIDNETMGHSLKELQKIDWDILEFIFVSMLYFDAEIECDPFIDPGTVNDEQWERVVIFYKAFVEGYISVFADERKLLLREYIVDLLHEWFEVAVWCVQELEQQHNVQEVKDHAMLEPFAHADLQVGTWEGFIDFLAGQSKDGLEQVMIRLNQAKKVLC